MATKIVTKNSSTASAVPTASDLVQGELAVNVADKRLFTEDNGGAIVELGTNPYNFTANHDGSAKLATTSTGIDVTGTATMDVLTVDGTGDGVKATIGKTGGTNLNIYADTNTVYLAGSSALSTAYIIDQTNNNMQFKVNAAERMRIDSSGRVGIGTSSVIGNLNLHGGTGDTASQDVVQTFTRISSTGNRLAAKIRLDNYDTSHADLKFQVKNIASSAESDSYYTDAMTIQGTSGNVGIGTSSPDVKLDVQGDTGVRVNSNGNASYVELKHTGSGVYTLGTYNYSDGGDIGGVLAFATNSNQYNPHTERMRIDSSGNLLVGTTVANPAGANSVGVGISSGSYGGFIGVTRDGNTPVEINRKTSDGNLITFRKDSSSVGSIGTVDGDIYVGTGDTGLFFSDANNEIRPYNTSTQNSVDATIDLGRSASRFKDLYLSGATKLFSGTNSPSANSTLGDVDFGARTDGTVTARVRGIAGSNGNGTDGQLTFYTASNTASQVAQERMRIDSSGNLLVGTTSAAGKLTLRQDSTTASPLFIVNAAISGKFATFEGNGAVHGSITWSGSTTSYNTSSDQRLKENIADADDAGSKIDAIQVRQYDWKADGSHQDYGMIAQELQAVAPEAVSVPEDSEEMMGVDYSKLVPMLIKEIQSLRNRVAQLEE